MCLFHAVQRRCRCVPHGSLFSSCFHRLYRVEPGVHLARHDVSGQAKRERQALPEFDAIECLAERFHGRHVVFLFHKPTEHKSAPTTTSMHVTLGEGSTLWVKISPHT